jgi:hypothetical protein
MYGGKGAFLKNPSEPQGIKKPPRNLAELQDLRVAEAQKDMLILFRL